MISLGIVSKHTSKSKKARNLIATVLIGVFIAGSVTSGIVRADRFDDQMNQLRAQNNNLQAQRQSLLSEASSLEAAIGVLQAEIAEIESQIQANQTKRAEIQQQIVETEAEIVRQRKVLGENIRAMYLEGDMSTVEMLASSQDLGDFVDKEQYRLSVQDKIKSTLDRINALRDSLQSQKVQLEKLIADQQAMQGQLATQRAEQAQLLALNAGQRSTLDGEIRANSNKIGGLRSQQAAANARLFGTGLRTNVPDSTGYPWANIQPFPNTHVDPWGMYKRQCVSYTAWKVWKSGRHMPYWGGVGNANHWDDNARRAGIPVDGSPRVGDVAVSNSGYYGHVMYVEAVHGDGTISISQYNAGWDGRYSEARIARGNLVFIHF